MTPSSARDSGAQTAFIGLGANLGDACASLAQAVRQIGQLTDTSIVAVSSLYRSAPVESSGPDYFNAVLQLETWLSPSALLRELQRIESEHGRTRPHFNAPRTLDLDVLAFGAISQADAELTLPHPRAHLRAFVLHPWHELAPAFELPGIGPISALLGTISDQAVERVAASHEWLASSTTI